MCREGREEKVGGSWQRERKQRRIVSSVQGAVCAIPAVSPVTGTCGSHMGPLPGVGGSAQGCHSVNS